ncbi:hypothetical protein GW17_00026679 [Ensete ventricosum]|nr:hypothetical protein GW17_00026679 [Ensete ventricosum]
MWDAQQWARLLCWPHDLAGGKNWSRWVAYINKYGRTADRTTHPSRRGLVSLPRLNRVAAVQIDRWARLRVTVLEMVRGPPPCRSRRIGRGKVEKGRGKTILRLKGQILPKPYHSFPVVDSRYDSPSPTTGGAAVCRSSHSRSLARSWTTFWCQVRAESSSHLSGD